MAKNDNKITIKPLHDYVLVRPVETQETTVSGIVIPDSAKEKPQVGEVMAIGPGAHNPKTEKLAPMSVKVGQKVLYKKWGGNEVKVGYEEWMLIEDKDIMAVVQ